MRLARNSAATLVLALSTLAQGPWSESEASEPRGLRTRAEGAFEGHTLFAPLNSTITYLMDLNGEIVHSWECDSSPAGGMYLLEDGTLLRCGREDEDPRFRGGGIGGRIQRLAPDGSVLWHYQLASEDRHQHHDLAPLPNGNVLAITWERVPSEAAVALGRHPDHVGKAGMWPDAVIEIRPTPPEGGEIVWTWRTWDHVAQDVDPNLPGYASIPEHPGRLDLNYDHRDQPPPTEEELEQQRELEAQMEALGYLGGEEEDEEEGGGLGANPYDRSGDWLHTNSVDYHAGYDLIALSSPELCEIFVIDHSTTTAEAAGSKGGRWGRGGEILWRWGNPVNYGLGSAADQRLFYQHHPTWVDSPDGELRMLVFNNGGGRPDGSWSSVEELVLPFDPERGFLREAGEPFGPAEPAWVYENGDDFFSAFISGCQRLPNGNTLICSGAPGRLFEVAPDGEVVWDYRSGLGGEVKPPEHAGGAPPLALFRGTRYASDDPGVRALLP